MKCLKFANGSSVKVLRQFLNKLEGCVDVHVSIEQNLSMSLSQFIGDSVASQLLQ
jgi:hypothetical protein